MTTYQILVFMKKMFYSLTCLLGLSACSSENIALDAMKVYDVANSTCKMTLSPTETRPDFYLENSMGPASLGMELGKDGVVRCTLEDVEANCAVRKIHVDIAHQGNQIVLVVYHNPLDALADCFCKYDVSFKMSRLTPGSYNLQVYYADPAMKYDKTGLVYKGEVEVALGKTVRVSLKPGAVLPES